MSFGLRPDRSAPKLKLSRAVPAAVSLEATPTKGRSGKLAARWRTLVAQSLEQVRED